MSVSPRANKCTKFFFLCSAKVCATHSNHSSSLSLPSLTVERTKWLMQHKKNANEILVMAEDIGIVNRRTFTGFVCLCLSWPNTTTHQAIIANLNH